MNAIPKTDWDRLSPLLDEFLDLPEADRGARLEALRATDAALADALAGMLARLPALERAGFLDTPAIPRPAGLAGQAIGAYTLERELGHGGMGTVWLARRTDGRYQGEVAIKFLLSGLFGHGDAARFEREGSILARLSHPHIARLLDAGIEANGAQPYLVLEYIDGEPIDRYCRQRTLSTTDRLKLFLDVLGAVAHAHNRLILHRDLKPSNILVTGAGEVKLLDFGIAKLLDEAGNAATALTAHAGNAFTPEFAAPEQMQAGEVTTATDVYSLGVLMYLLLSGRHPTTAPTGAPLDRMRAVVEAEPQRLSDAVLRGDGAHAKPSPATRRLSHELRGDIDTIVAQALKKSPSQRYANAAELADDVRRYMAHEPIAARPDTRLYQLTKFVRRHRPGVIAAGAVVLALAAGAGVASWQAREARAQRTQAEGLIEFMLGDLRRKLEPVGRLDVLDGVGDKALAYYAAQDPGNLDADSLGRRSRALHMIGDLAEQRGKLDEAQNDFQQAAESTRELLKRHPDDGQRLFDHAQSEYGLGLVQWRRGRLHDAEAAFRRYAALADRMVALDPANADWRLEQASAAQNVAIVLIDLGEPAQALEMSRRAHLAMAGIMRARPDAILDDATILGWIAHAEVGLGRYADAIATEEKKIATTRNAPDGAKNQEIQYLVATSHVATANWLLDLGRLDEAMWTARRGLEENLALSALDPSNVDWLYEVVNSRLQVATLLAEHNLPDEARALLAQTVEPLSRLAAQPMPKRSWRIGQIGRARVLHARLANTPAESEAAGDELEAYAADIRRFEHEEGGEMSTEDALVVAQADLARGDLLARARRTEDARAAWQASAGRMRSPSEHGDPAAMVLLGLSEIRLGAAKQAGALVDSVMATSYRPPALADLQKLIGPAQKTGVTPSP